MRKSEKTMYQQFFNAVFDGWGSTHKTNNPKELPARMFCDTSMEVGFLKIHHPLSQAQIRAGEVEQKRRARLASAPVYLGLTLNLEEECIAWLWRDSEERFINPKYIEYNPGMSKAKARIAVIENYDDAERTRIVSHNRSQVVSAARRRIVKWARDGSSVGTPTVDNKDYAKDVQPLVLASDFVLREKLVAMEMWAAFDDGDERLVENILNAAWPTPSPTLTLFFIDFEAPIFLQMISYMLLCLELANKWFLWL
ncbi:hypothetical protein FDECE_162 [Fusarium decemcellulare]|nr:hypothetical protein FDECE_162 [Fusarium decemcellulare]